MILHNSKAIASALAAKRTSAACVLVRSFPSWQRRFVSRVSLWRVRFSKFHKDVRKCETICTWTRIHSLRDTFFPKFQKIVWIGMAFVQETFRRILCEVQNVICQASHCAEKCAHVQLGFWFEQQLWHTLAFRKLWKIQGRRYPLPDPNPPRVDLDSFAPLGAWASEVSQGNDPPPPPPTRTKLKIFPCVTFRANFCARGGDIEQSAHNVRHQNTEEHPRTNVLWKLCVHFFIHRIGFGGGKERKISFWNCKIASSPCGRPLTTHSPSSAATRSWGEARSFPLASNFNTTFVAKHLVSTLWTVRPTCLQGTPLETWVKGGTQRSTPTQRKKERKKEASKQTNKQTNGKAPNLPSVPTPWTNKPPDHGDWSIDWGGWTMLKVAQNTETWVTQKNHQWVERAQKPFMLIWIKFGSFGISGSIWVNVEDNVPGREVWSLNFWVLWCKKFKSGGAWNLGVGYKYCSMS